MKTAEPDVVERRENARNQAAELEVIYRRAPLGLAVYDRNLRFLRVNDALGKFNNLTPAEHVGRRVVDVVPQFGREIAKCLERVFAS